MGQLSLFGVASRDPTPGDLEGLLAGNGHAVTREGSARISVVVEDSWRVDAITAELADRHGVAAETGPAETGTSVGTPWIAELLPSVQAWTHGSRIAPPPGWECHGARLRWWCLAAGRAAPGMYTLALGPNDEHSWLALGSALSGAGVAGLLIGPRAAGPAYRIVGRRRLGRLVELVGDAPPGAPGDAWPTMG